MFRKLADWFDNRTGYRKLMQVMLLEHIPGGAKWRYVWGSCLAFVFMLQLITGILLMTAYSPGNSTAWGSVYFIQYEMEFGWLIRGLHHFGSQTMVILLGIHMLQVVIAGAQLPPREINWWIGLALMGLVLALSLTGYLLPWDQKGYYATQVATNIAGGLPGIGSFARRVIVGGPEYGNATLSRFYTLHVGILPPVILVLIVAHIYVFRRHGVTAPKDAEGEGMFWPDQAFRDMVACVLIFAVLLGLVFFGGHGNPVPHSAFYRPTAEQIEKKEPAPEPTWWDHIALRGRDGAGANLDAPADPGQPYPARPEWYFLFLFQLLKYFQGEQMIIGTVLIPNGVGLLLFLLPLFGYGKLRTFGHILGVIVVVSLLTSIGALTCLALADDMVDAERRALLTRIGTVLLPATGGFFLIYLAILGVLRRGGFRRVVSVLGGAVTALLLAADGSLIYGAMSDYLPDQVRAYVREQMTPAERDPQSGPQTVAEGFNHQLEKAEKSAKRAVELAPAGIPAEGAVVLLQRDPMTRGKELFKLKNCAVCHSYEYKGEGHDAFHEPKDKVAFKASDLAGFGTKAWIRGLLRDPDDPRYFGHTPFKGGTMSEFIQEQLDPADPAKAKKAAAAFDLIADWLATRPKEPPKDGEAAELQQGYAAFKQSCQRCHSFAGEGGTTSNRGPDLTGYGGADWLRLMIADPHDPWRYGRKNANVMPLFRDKKAVTWPVEALRLERDRKALFEKEKKEVPEVDPKANAEDQENAKLAAKKAQTANEKLRKQIQQSTEVMDLSAVERELIIRFLLHDDRVVFGGNPISGPKKR